MDAVSYAMRVTVLGARGSVPVSGPDYRVFGGATSCLQIEAEGRALLLDAGTGILRARLPAEGPLDILFTHTHADHTLGLPMLPALGQAGRLITLWGVPREGLPLEAQLERLISPPLWPVRLADFPAAAGCRAPRFPLALPPFTVTAAESCHPGGSLIYRVEAGGRSLVYATDFEHRPGAVERLTAFSRGTDLLLYDAQYTPEEYPRRQGFGHSTAEMGLLIARECGARQLLLIHHDPSHTDAMLMERERQLGARFAREGEVIVL